MRSTTVSLGIGPVALPGRPHPPAGAHARRRLPLLTAMALLLVVSSHAHAQVDIDSFTSSTPQSTPPNSEVVALVVGGFRDVKSNNAGNVASAASGRFRCSGTANFQGCTVQYDGNDGDPVTFTPGGFGVPVDFTAGGQDRIMITTFVAAGACNLFFEICDDVLLCDSASVAGIANGGTIELFYADFDPGLDFGAISALQVNLTPTAVPVDCSVGPLLTGPDPLIFADGFATGNTSAWSSTVP